MTKICLCDKPFVATKLCLSRQNVYRDRYLSQQICFCRDGHTFVATRERERERQRQRERDRDSQTDRQRQRPKQDPLPNFSKVHHPEESNIRRRKMERKKSVAKMSTHSSKRHQHPITRDTESHNSGIIWLGREDTNRNTNAGLDAPGINQWQTRINRFRGYDNYQSRQTPPRPRLL